jgi:IS5 family transposase
MITMTVALEAVYTLWAPDGSELVFPVAFRTVGDQCSLWESVLPEELLRLSEELARVDVLLDDPAFFASFVPFFDPRMGRPSIPMETYLRLMFLKSRPAGL